MNPQSNIAAMNTPTTQDLPNAEDYRLAMIAAPFAATGHLTDAEALARARLLLGAAYEDRFQGTREELGKQMQEVNTRSLSMLVIEMGVKERSAWKHVAAVVGKKETARLQAAARLDPAARLFAQEVSKRILDHQKASYQKRNRKVARNAHRPILK